MSARLQGQGWLTDPATLAVLDALEAAGGPDCARFVGGCVRNALIGRPVDDIDIATTLEPEATAAAVKAAGLKAVPTGIAHGTVTAVASGKPFEITTLRRDVSTDGRNATVAFTDDWAEDAARRDFRLNALYADREGRVIDPTGEGVLDAIGGRIVFVGDPETRIREDYLRILRFFRFLAWYGKGEPNAAALDACAAMKDGMVRLSAERVSKELLKLLAASDPRPALELMAGVGVLAKVLPEVRDRGLFAAMVETSDDSLVRLSALLPPDVKSVAVAATRLRLSNGQRDRLIEAVPDAVAVTPDMDDRAARAALYRLGGRRFEDRLTLALAAARDEAQGAWRLRRLAADWIVPKIPVGGHDVARLGGGSGPETGRLLKAFEEGWIADDFPETGHNERLAALIEEART